MESQRQPPAPLRTPPIFEAILARSKHTIATATTKELKSGSGSACTSLDSLSIIDYYHGEDSDDGAAGGYEEEHGRSEEHEEHECLEYEVKNMDTLKEARMSVEGDADIGFSYYGDIDSSVGDELDSYYGRDYGAASGASSYYASSHYEKSDVGSNASWETVGSNAAEDAPRRKQEMQYDPNVEEKETEEQQQFGDQEDRKGENDGEAEGLEDGIEQDSGWRRMSKQKLGKRKLGEGIVVTGVARSVGYHSGRFPVKPQPPCNTSIRPQIWSGTTRLFTSPTRDRRDNESVSEYSSLSDSDGAEGIGGRHIITLGISNTPLRRTRSFRRRGVHSMPNVALTPLIMQSDARHDARVAEDQPGTDDPRSRRPALVVDTPQKRSLESLTDRSRSPSDGSCDEYLSARENIHERHFPLGGGISSQSRSSTPSSVVTAICPPSPDDEPQARRSTSSSWREFFSDADEPSERDTRITRASSNASRFSQIIAETAPCLGMTAEELLAELNESGDESTESSEPVKARFGFKESQFSLRSKNKRHKPKTENRSADLRTEYEAQERLHQVKRFPVKLTPNAHADQLVRHAILKFEDAARRLSASDLSFSYKNDASTHYNSSQYTEDTDFEAERSSSPSPPPPPPPTYKTKLRTMSVPDWPLPAGYHHQDAMVKGPFPHPKEHQLSVRGIGAKRKRTTWPANSVQIMNREEAVFHVPMPPRVVALRKSEPWKRSKGRSRQRVVSMSAANSTETLTTGANIQRPTSCPGPTAEGDHAVTTDSPVTIKPSLPSTLKSDNRARHDAWTAQRISMIKDGRRPLHHRDPSFDPMEGRPTNPTPTTSKRYSTTQALLLQHYDTSSSRLPLRTCVPSPSVRTYSALSSVLRPRTPFLRRNKRGLARLFAKLHCVRFPFAKFPVSEKWVRRKRERSVLRKARVGGLDGGAGAGSGEVRIYVLERAMRKLDLRGHGGDED